MLVFWPHFPLRGLKKVRKTIKTFHLLRICINVIGWQGWEPLLLPHDQSLGVLMRRFFAGVAILCFFFQVAVAATPEPVQLHNSNAVWFENWIGLSNATLSVTAPNGETIEVFAASGTPVFQLSGRDIQDGYYRYELRAATEEQKKIVNATNQGRGDAQRDSVAVPYYATGNFLVERGVIVIPEDIKEE